MEQGIDFTDDDLPIIETFCTRLIDFVFCFMLKL